MKTIILLLFTCLLVISSGTTCTSQKNTTDKSSQNSLEDSLLSVTIKIKDDKNIALRSGYNTTILPYHLEKSYDALLPLLKDLSPQILRFPGGTIANYYHPEEAGYGISQEALKDKKVRESHGMVINQHNRVKEEKIADNYKIPFTRLCKDLNASVLIVANLLDGNLKETMELIQHFKKNYIDIAGVELGNEYYLNGYIPQFPTVEKYIKKCRNFSSAIRRQFPDLKIGVVVAPNQAFGNIPTKRASRFKTWNELLSNERFYDAIITHIYAKADDCADLASMKERYDCALNESDQYADKNLQKIIKEYLNIFNDRPKIWITEWNLKSKSKEMPFGDTFLQACYALDFVFNAIRINKVLGESIEYSTYHNLCAGGEAYALLNPALQNKSQSEFIKNSAYYSFLMLRDVISEEVISIGIDNNVLPDKLDVGVFYDKERSKLYCYITNKSNKEISNFHLDFSNFEGRVSSLTQLKAKSLNSKNEALEFYKEALESSYSSSYKYDRTVPAMSINKLVIEIKKI